MELSAVELKEKLIDSLRATGVVDDMKVSRGSTIEQFDFNRFRIPHVFFSLHVSVPLCAAPGEAPGSIHPRLAHAWSSRARGRCQEVCEHERPAGEQPGVRPPAQGALVLHTVSVSARVGVRAEPLPTLSLLLISLMLLRAGTVAAIRAACVGSFAARYRFRIGCTALSTHALTLRVLWSGTELCQTHGRLQTARARCCRTSCSTSARGRGSQSVAPSQTPCRSPALVRVPWDTSVLRFCWCCTGGID